MYALTIEPLNYAAVFGVMLGFTMIIQLESLAKNAMIFMKGWKN